MFKKLGATLCIGTGIALSACGKPPGGDLLDLATDTLTFDVISKSILEPKCGACHSGGSAMGGIDFSSHAQTLATGSVVPFASDQSTLYLAARSGTMPKGGSKLSQLELQAIQSWINGGAISVATPGSGGGDTNPPPNPGDDDNSGSGGGGGGSPAEPLVATYASIEKKILKPKCLGCHSSANPEGGVSVSSYADTVKLVTAGKPNPSLLFKVTRMGRMPQGGPALTQTELTAISDWIQAGAANN